MLLFQYRLIHIRWPVEKNTFNLTQFKTGYVLYYNEAKIGVNLPYVKISNKMLSDLTSGSNMNGLIPNFLRLSALSRERQVPLITQSGKALFSELTRARPEYPSPKMKTWEGVTSAL